VFKSREMLPGVGITTTAQGKVSTANCAGQGCPERRECRRWRVIVPASGQSRDFVHRDTLGAWMSFDLERQARGDCSAFVRHREAR
jgi:hypothetical protein